MTALSIKKALYCVYKYSAILSASCFEMPKLGIAVPGLILSGAMIHSISELSWFVSLPAINLRLAQFCKGGPILPGLPHTPLISWQVAHPYTDTRFLPILGCTIAISFSGRGSQPSKRKTMVNRITLKKRWCKPSRFFCTPPIWCFWFFRYRSPKWGAKFVKRTCTFHLRW